MLGVPEEVKVSHFKEFYFWGQYPLFLIQPQSLCHCEFYNEVYMQILVSYTNLDISI